MKIYNGDTLVLDIQVDDDSYRYRAVMGDDSLTLKFSLSQHVEIPVGSHCIFQNDTYTLMRPENLVMRHTRNFEYTVIMESYKAYLGMYKFRNTVDGRLKFSLTARPEEHLQMLVDNMNQRDAGWTIGECIDSTEKLITYNHTYCVDAITQIAEMFNTEWEVSGKRISLKKVEYNKDNPLSLSYGKGNGFRPGIGRTNFDDTLPVEVLYVQGGSRNIDAGKYGGSELLLPKGVTIKYDGVHFEDEIGFNSANARTYKTDDGGFSIRRADKSLTNGAEDSQDFSEIYPHRDEKILKVIVVNEDENWYDVVTDAPESLDYSQYGIGGETPTIVFQDGELAGREFDLETDDDGNIICEKYYDNGKFTGWKFQIVPTTLDGVVMPGGSFVPVVGNIFRVFGIQLPEAYIEDNATKSGASWEMFREGVKYLYDHEDKRFTFTGELDGIWAKKDWINIGGKIKLGGFVSFSDARFQPEPVLIRITGIKDYVNNPYSPEIELSNSTVRGGVSSTLKKINNNQADAERLYSDAVNFTKRRFRDAKETISMLEAAMLQGFTDSISPLTVQTMSMLVGDESLQFRFVQSRENPQPVAHAETYDDETKILSIEGGVLQHMTLGIKAISTSSGHAASEYRFWTLPAFDSPTLSESDKGYYVYAKVSRTEDTGVFYMSETARSMEADPDCYYLLMGILNSELDGARSYVSLYGFSEILPGRITTDVLRDPDGNLIIDLANALITAKNGARINANLTIGPDSSGLGNLSEWSDAEDSINNAQSTANSALQDAAKAQDTADQKRRVFVTTPYTPYDVGDMWTAGPTGDIMRCIKARATGNYTASDWDKASKYTDDTKALEALSAVNNVNAGLSALSSTVSDLDEYVDGAFRDGVINDAESIAIKKYLNTVNESWADLQASYNVVYNNSSLTGTPKTNLKNAYNTLSTRKTSLVNAINTAVSNPSSANITAVDTAFTNYNSAVGTFKNALENANKSIQDGIRNDVSDLDYLKNTFGYVVDVNGVVLGKLVAVKDDNGEVQAMMNGSTLGKDSTHGKLLIAGGISDIAHPENAKTRIYEDGTIDTKKLVAHGGGKIGNFNITEGIGITVYDSSSTSTTYSSSYFQLWDDGGGMIIGKEEKKGNTANSFNRTVKIIATPWGSADIGDGEGSFPSASDRLSTAMGISSIERGTGPGIVENIALLLESKGNAKAERNLAIKCLSGMFAGLRPKVRTISAATTLTTTDHTILVDSTASFTITLPSTAELGQEYILLFGGSTYTQHTKVLACASPIIHCQLDDIWNAKSLNLTSQGAVFIVYANDVNGDGRWWVTRLA